MNRELKKPRKILYDQLTSEYGEQFTPEQAEYGLKYIGY